MKSAIRSYVNRINSQKSTGPKTPEGRQRASMNAVTHGLTAQRMIMQPHELIEYRRLSAALYRELRPQSEQQRQLVQKIVDTHMRLNRIAAIENNILNISLVEEVLDTPHDDATETMLAQARAWMNNEATFERLSRYRARATRELLQCTKELERLQELRRARPQDTLETRQADENGPDLITLASFCKPISNKVMTAGAEPHAAPDDALRDPANLTSELPTAA